MNDRDPLDKTSANRDAQPCWTWHQYTIVRVLFGSYLLVHFIHLLPWAAELFSSAGMLPDAELSPLVGIFPNLLVLFDHPATATAFIASGVIASLALLCGRSDRAAAVWVWFLLACLFGRNPLIANPSLPVVGWLLLFHACLPSRHPPGKRTPDYGAALPQTFFALAWFMLAIAYSYSGWTKLFSDAWVQGETVRWVLENPLARDTSLREALLTTPAWLLEAVTLGILGVELLFAPLALVRCLRPWLWVLMLLVQVGFLVLLNFADLTMPMLLLHLLTFDPRWVRHRQATPATLYYDGDCGFCHGWVRFVLDEDRAAVFRFAPLQAGVGSRAKLPDDTVDFDSMIVETANGQHLRKFAAARFILAQLPGLWSVIASLLHVVPATLGNSGYDFVARNRKRLARAPTGWCPVVPGPLRERFVPGSQVSEICS